MNTPQLGIGIIGTGFGAWVHLPGFLRIPDVQVIGIASKDPTKSMALAAEHGLRKVYASPAELIADPDVNVVSIASPQATHAEYIRAAIAAGKHVLCEKPFTLNAQEASQLYATAQEAGIVHAVDFEFPELSAWQAFRKQAEAGNIGTLQKADFRWVVGTWADLQRPWRWQCDAEQGGGVMSALGVHLFDAVEWILGPVQSVQATMETAIAQRPDGERMKDVTSEDHAVIRMKTVNAVDVLVTLSNVDAHGDGLTMTLHGEQGTLTLDNPSKEYGRGMRVRERIDGRSETLLPVTDIPDDIDPRIPPFQSLAERFISAIRDSDAIFRPSFFEGMRSTMIRDASLQSARTGEWVDIVD